MRSKGSHGVFAPSALRCPKKSSRCSLARFFRPLRVLRLAASATGGARLRTPYPSPAAGEGPSRQIAARSTHRLGIITFCYRFAVTPIKCAAGTLKAYLRCRTDDAFASFVSSRSLSVRGSWGTAPSVFWYGVPGGTQGPLGKGGAAERWRVAYPIGIATRHGVKPATTHTSKRNASAASGDHHAFAKDSTTPTGDYQLGQNSFAAFFGEKQSPPGPG